MTVPRRRRGRGPGRRPGSGSLMILPSPRRRGTVTSHDSDSESPPESVTVSDRSSGGRRHHKPAPLAVIRNLSVTCGDSVTHSRWQPESHRHVTEAASLPVPVSE